MDILVFKALITSEREVVHETLGNEELNFHGWLSRNVSKLYLRLPNGLKCKIIEIKECDLIISFNTRCDVFFATKCENASKFAIPRLHFGIRWAEDAIPQDENIYPKYVKEYLK